MVPELNIYNITEILRKYPAGYLRYEIHESTGLKHLRSKQDYSTSDLATPNENNGIVFPRKFRK